MYWLDNNTGISTAPTPPAVISLTKKFFTNGGLGEQPSIPEDFWFNMVQEELLGVLAMAGIAPVKSDLGQLAKAIQSIAFSAYPVGAPIPWPTAVPPSGFLAMTGQPFSPATYPKLALAYPSLVIPDMRAEFIRGFDNGRGKDSGRSILSGQLGSLVVGETVDRAISLSRMQNVKSIYFDASTDSSTSIATSGIAATLNSIVNPNSQYVGVTRPTNIAFNYIVRAL